MSPCRFVFVSSVLPVERGAGQLLMYRHLSLLDPSKFEFAVTRLQSERSSTEFQEIIVARRRWDQLWRGTALERICSNWTLPRALLVNHGDLKEQVAAFRPTCLLTVAHGELFYSAQRLSRELKLPLVSVFHDWWPHKAKCGSSGRRLIEHDFRLAAQESARTLCVCDGMKVALGSPANSEKLYPISFAATNLKTPTLDADDGAAVLAYSGNLTGPHGAMVRQLYEAMTDNVNGEFVFSGPTEHGMSKHPGYQGHLSPEQNLAFLTDADFLLVTMLFGDENRRLAETSFPSKLVDYCHAGKPIIVWGPEYSSASRWGRQSKAAAIVDASEPAAVIETMKELRQSPERQRSLVANARSQALGEFEREKLQKRFEDALMAACHQGAEIQS